MSSGSDSGFDVLSRVPSYRVEDDVLDPETHASLLEFALMSEPFFVPALTGGIVQNPKHRQAKKMRDDRFADWRRRLKPGFHKRAVEAAQAFDVDEQLIDHFEIKLIRHNHGDFYYRHRDVLVTHPDIADGQRLVSMVYYLHRAKRVRGGCAAVILVRRQNIGRCGTAR